MISVEIHGDREALARLTRIGDLANQNVKKAVSGSLLNIRNGAQQRVRVDTSRLKTAIHIVQDSDGLGGMVTPDSKETMIYAAVNELGRKPGGKMPPFSPGTALYRWAERRRVQVSSIKTRKTRTVRLFKTDSAVRSFAFLVARKIAVKGTPAQPYLKPSLLEEIPRFQKAVEEAVSGAVKAGEQG